MTTSPATRAWRPLHPSKSLALADSRLQFHYAAQFATALGISFLPRKDDDSHTNLGWMAAHEALCSREVQGHKGVVQVAVQPRHLTLLVLREGTITCQVPLHGLTVSHVETTLRDTLAESGLDGRRLTLKRHYELPSHNVSHGEPFDVSSSDEFAELAHWYGNAANLLEEFRSAIAGDEVRCWPHHFDIATLATIAPGRTSGAGMLAGDQQVPEPYYYVNAYPPPGSDRATAPLAGGGYWNTEGWFGAVLTGSRLSADSNAQAAQVRAFLDSAFEACASLLRGQSGPLRT